ncbi:MAG TPA: PPC domain-containing DNA-binding protein [Magnetospirillaceae bacterium]|nr:PPC domain-containing DNA-binding protein [Magnetospirillaceae bacterium]
MQIRTEYALSEIGRTLIGRIFPGTELVPGILQMCAESGIRFGYVASLIGSLTRVRLVYVNRAPEPDPGFRFSEPLDRPGPFEILSAQGTLGEDEAGKPSLHLHALLCDEKNRILGGHILDAGNPVLATIEVVIRETRGIQLVQKPDQEMGVPLFRVQSRF